jgi:predicted ATPase
MLESLDLKHVGPASKLHVELKPRMNFLAGDNGLGKSFLLDVAWWALTRTWPGQPAFPHRGKEVKPSISYRYETKKGSVEYQSFFNRKAENWPVKRERAPLPGMVIYAQVDGGFSVWDPARNSWTEEVSAKRPPRPSAYIFKVDEVWNGLRDGERSLCEGLIRDWASWQREGGEAFQQLTSVLSRISPSPQEALVPGKLTRISVAESVDHPTIKMPYGQEVPLVYASAGIRRIVALAYLLVWTWQEHLHAAELQGEEPIQEITFLIDEVEAHLHPQWQRRIVPALLDVMEALTGRSNAVVQLIAATHSPLVLASTETQFDPERDAIWELDLRDGGVELHESPWMRRGDANAWLTSSVFELKEARSVEAEEAITQALALLRQDTPQPGEIERVDGLLRNALSDVDRFWVRWSEYRKALAEVR